jgi:hypothetical protein
MTLGTMAAVTAGIWVVGWIVCKVMDVAIPQDKD